MSLSPEPTLNWFNLPATKTLILSDEIEAAKKWIFLVQVILKKELVLI